MKFAVGFWDSIFGEKITIEIPSPSGQIIKRKVSKKWFYKMKGEKQIKEIKEEMIRVHMINPLAGDCIENWAVGKDIDSETGDLYAMTSFENGQQKISVLKKDFWEKARKLMDSI